MSVKTSDKVTRRQRRHNRIRARVSGTATRPRLAVHRSIRFTTAQLIDDASGKTLVGMTTKGMTVADAGDRKGKSAVAYALGQEVAKKAKEQGIESIVFDRGGYAYHGRVKAVADGARDAGLKF